MSKYQRALVTGGAGFIGSHLVDALIRRRIKTYVVDDLSTGRKENLNPNATFVRASVATPAFTNLIEKIRPDIVFHTAAQINVRTSVSDPLLDARVNVLGTVGLIQAAARAGVKKIVFSSTGGAMFSDRLRPPFRETDPADPVSPYGISKRAGEMYLEFAAATYGLSTVSLRYANVYGPRQTPKGEAGVIAIFGEKMIAGKPCVINGTGKQTRDFVYVGDVVAANLLAMSKPVTGIFHVGTGKETNVVSVFKKLNALTGKRAEERHAPGMQGEVMRSALDSRKAAKQLGWKPEIGLDEGLQRTIDWMKKRV